MTAIWGGPLLRILRHYKIGKVIRVEEPGHHGVKMGTPTMGGIAIVGATVLGYIAAHARTEQLKFARTGVTLVLLIVGLAVVGFVDDYLAVRRGRNLGLRKRGKTGGELLVASGFALLALRWVDVSTHLSFTRTLDLELGTWVWFAMAVVVIYGTSNAVNLTDGMDGLAAGSATLVFAAFMIICFWQFRHPFEYGAEAASAIDLAVVAAALTGACGGFLWWNAAPARIFMGDTGSLPSAG
jgi:phospho-N-acetylmuramoyl-pentapeptide-transferase